MGKKDKQEEIFDAFCLENTVYFTRVPESYKNREIYKPLNEKALKAFIPGIIREMQVKVGDIVQKGDQLMILDAMKMNNVVRTLFSGKIIAVNVKEGDMVKKNQIIVEFE
ncbi:MAG: acetyl-CoA carboxylase biotin carboxyl carrier protein subunit [Bacteroidales bacterium]|jgi:biotin carboxyl carrier protein|nr:acetyl-CoA carboxylase biotin carboxyl carrier protein subunit [Bacteroidales bacterium]